MACYPQFKQFLELKRKYDPLERFQSDWYRYYRKLSRADDQMTEARFFMQPFAIIALVLNSRARNSLNCG
jgi:hypothetical protein